MMSLNGRVEGMPRGTPSAQSPLTRRHSARLAGRLEPDCEGTLSSIPTEGDAVAALNIPSPRGEELGQGSFRPFAQASTEAVVATANSEGHDLVASAVRPAGDPAARSTKSEDRTCRKAGCTTILSAYNTTTACWAHTAPHSNSVASCLRR